MAKTIAPPDMEKLALLPGLRQVLNNTLAEYNVILGSIGMNPLEFSDVKPARGGQPSVLAIRQAEGLHELPVVQAASAPPAPAKRPMSEEARRKLSLAAKKRWKAARKSGKTKL